MASTVVKLGEIDYDRWRAQARDLLATGILPNAIEWIDPTDENLWGQSSLDQIAAAFPSATSSRGQIHVPREFPTLAKLALCHRDPAKWPLLYRLLWRLADAPGRGLLRNALDDDVFTLRAMAKSVKRDVHKMKAFVRFRRVPDGQGHDHFIAYHRPDHPIIRIAAPFFARRFGVLQWTILTPFGSATWRDGELTFGPPAARSQAPDPDDLEEFWKTYYASTFNPARANPRAMQKEMPRKYWSTLPEADLIEQLLAEAPVRTGGMLTQPLGGPVGAAAFIPSRPADGPVPLPVLRSAASSCRGCELYEHATCTVFGEGNPGASLMLIGEQPGDHEDLAGKPFIGPAGMLLDRALRDADIDRAACYVTNAVKHFRWTPEPRGKRRLHAKPTAANVRACRSWLEAELAAIQPTAIVLLGATAGHALFGPGFRVQQNRGKVLRDTAYAPAVIPTIHPSSILRIGDATLSEREYDSLVRDLRLARTLLARSGTR